MAERSSSEAEKAAWTRIAQKLATFALALCLAVGFSLPQKSEASVGSGHNVEHSIHYAKCDIGPSRGSWAPAGAGSSSGSALASPLGHPARTRLQHDRDGYARPHQPSRPLGRFWLTGRSQVHT
ncbi:DUF3693 domain-containing protein [Stenotrophomonas rhizophila]|uniref:DUF3693 domain-containing protein n=1 Tax=Stenotrophomonas rhizophila TaxID=216778 RepID=UPI0028B0CF64|nr:DUF3693 domain-containing protein [Stenotrophomonas rhizophila]